VGEGPFGVNCLYAFGDFTDGDVLLWEAGLRIELRPGDLLFFPDGILHHSNDPVTGVRHSLVAFTPMNVFHYWHWKYNYEDPRFTDLKKRRDEYERIKKIVEKKMQIVMSKVRKRKRKGRSNRKKEAESCLRN
jgi:ribosomal protein L16 Arg81 hydroxylase